MKDTGLTQRNNVVLEKTITRMQKRYKTVDCHTKQMCVYSNPIETQKAIKTWE